MTDAAWIHRTHWINLFSERKPVFGPRRCVLFVHSFQMKLFYANELRLPIKHMRHTRKPAPMMSRNRWIPQKIMFSIDLFVYRVHSTRWFIFVWISTGWSCERNVCLHNYDRMFALTCSTCTTRVLMDDGICHQFNWFLSHKFHKRVRLRLSAHGRM